MFSLNNEENIQCGNYNIHVCWQLHESETKKIPWFRGKDVCIVLGYVDTTQAVIKNVSLDNIQSRLQINGVEKCTRNESMSKYLNISGLFQLILRSKLPAAREFEKWLFETGLPDLWAAGKIDVQKLLDNCGQQIAKGLHRQGYVYAITSPLVNAVKIGRWTDTLDTLLKRYNTYFGKSSVYVTCWVKDCVAVEADLLFKFKKYRIDGELFEKDKMTEIWACISGLTSYEESK